tara:strand:+ start:1042 stop:1278 length:237 start_codon:yes stop_codon:yes gene_type:complete
MDAKKERSLSSLSEAEANSSRRVFVISFLVFVIFAIVVHIVLWQWRPWTWLSVEAPALLDMLRANVGIFYDGVMQNYG